MTIRPQDFFGVSPKTVLNKPFFHAQDQKAYNVDGGTPVADAWTIHDLNTVIHNDTQGASLASNQISLPAGTYYVRGTFSCSGGTSAWNTSIAGIAVNGTIQLQGRGSVAYGSQATFSFPEVEGVITLSSPGTVDLRYYSGLSVATTGLGVSNNTGSITNASIPSIYADLKIWQLDRSLEIAPKAVNSGLQTVPGLNTEGHMMGFDVTVSGNVLTIGKGSCLDSTLTVPIAFTAAKTVTLPGTVNQDFFVFAVRLLDGVTFEPRAYTTLAGPESDAQIDAWQFISYAKNNGSGVTFPHVAVDGVIDFLTLSSTAAPLITSTMTTSHVEYTLSTVVDMTVLSELWICSTTSGCNLIASYNGSADISPASAAFTPIVLLPLSSIYLKYSNNNGPAIVRRIKLRR